MASGFTCKVYVVLQCDRLGSIEGVLAVKLNFADAQSLAKSYAPCKVVTVIADKTPMLNGPAHF